VNVVVLHARRLIRHLRSAIQGKTMMRTGAYISKL
jgi:hypothetical protein